MVQAQFEDDGHEHQLYHEGVQPKQAGGQRHEQDQCQMGAEQLIHDDLRRVHHVVALYRHIYAHHWHTIPHQRSQARCVHDEWLHGESMDPPHVRGVRLE